MNILYFNSPSEVIKDAAMHLYLQGEEYRSDKWQGKKTEKMHTMLSVAHYSFAVELGAWVGGDNHLLLNETGAQVPWAEDHFQERVMGYPLNPGQQYKNWKFYKHNPENDKYRTENERFTHTYMERFWPKHAGFQTDDYWLNEHNSYIIPDSNRGIRYSYGDLDDVASLIRNEPRTRQAYLPIWFPEDTGVRHGGRVPCTLGYHFQQVDEGYLNITYYIRACDYFRHFRDDIYLAVRLLEWVCDRVNLKPGQLIMHIADLHCFAHEKNMLKKHY